MADIKLPAPPQFHTHGPVALNPEGIRARDIEVARCVLEAAAKFIEQGGGFRAEILANAIRALEVSHD